MLSSVPLFSAGTILDEAWNDGSREIQNLPHSARWFSTGAEASQIAVPGTLTQTLGGSSAMALAYFTDAFDSTEELAVGETMRMTYEISFVNRTGAGSFVRIGLFNTVADPRIEEDGLGIQHDAYVGATGYMVDFGVGIGSGATFWRRTHGTSRNLVFGTSAYSRISRSADFTSEVVTDAAHAGVIEITRTDEETVFLFSELLDPAGDSVYSFSAYDSASNFFRFNTVGFASAAANGDAFRLHSVNISVFSRVLDEWVTDYTKLTAPFSLDFGLDAGQTGGGELLRNRPDDFTPAEDALRFSAGGVAVSSGALAVVGNYEEFQDFTIQTDITLEQLAERTSGRIGFAALGNGHAPPDQVFDLLADNGFYGLVWYPGEVGGNSTLRIQEGFNGPVLAETSWEGVSPFSAGETVLFSEDFEGGATGWTSGGAGNLWEMGVPVDGPGAAVSGVNVAATGLDEKYPANADAWLRTPAIDLHGAFEGTLRFWEYTDVDIEGIEFHSTTVTILDASTLEPIEGGELTKNADQTEQWRLREFSLPTAALEREIVLEFRLQSDGLGGGEYDGWFIDDVEVRGSSSAGAMGYSMTGKGTFNVSGGVALSFTLADQEGHEQTVSAEIHFPAATGPLFGIGGRLEAAGEPLFLFDNLSLELGTEPGEIVEDSFLETSFNLALGSSAGRDPGENLSLPAAWTVEADSLRLTADAAASETSFATSRFLDFDPAENHSVELEFTLAALGDLPAEDRIVLVVLGDEDLTVFDEEDASTFYTVQWIPNGSSGASLVFREGMDGSEIARTDFDDLPGAPATAAGKIYTLGFRALHGEAGDLQFAGTLTSEGGGVATVSGSLPEAPGQDRSRYGFGAGFGVGSELAIEVHRYMALETLLWIQPQSVEAPLDWQFGSGADRLGLLNPLPVLLGDGIFVEPNRLQDWGITPNSLRVTPQSSGNANSQLGVLVDNYEFGQNFLMTADITLENAGAGPWEQFFLYALSTPEGTGGYSVAFEVHQENGRIRFRDGLFTRLLQTGSWDGLHAGNGEGTTFHCEFAGEFSSEGVLTLSFTMTDENGHSQTWTQEIVEPNHGSVFGIAARGNSSGQPMFDYHGLSVSVGDISDPITGQSYAAWQDEHFSESQLADPAISGPEAAPIGDGVPNLLKYAFGFPPFEPVVQSDLVEWGTVENGLQLTYFERVQSPDLQYIPEVSEDLLIWEAGSEYIEVVEVEPTADGEYRRVTVQPVRESISPKRFLRVRVEQE